MNDLDVNKKGNQTWLTENSVTTYRRFPEMLISLGHMLRLANTTQTTTLPMRQYGKTPENFVSSVKFSLPFPISISSMAH